MLNTPYDDLLDPSTADLPSTRTFSQKLSLDDNFAAWVVEYLLDRYLLPQEKKFRILGQYDLVPLTGETYLSARRCFNAASDSTEIKRLYPECFCEEYTSFPMMLSSYYMLSGEAKLTTVPKLCGGSIEVPGLALLKRLQSFLYAKNSRRPAGVVISGWRPRVPIQDCLVIHGWHYVDTRLPGLHQIYTDNSGGRFVLERLGTLLDRIDAFVEPSTWIGADWGWMIWDGNRSAVPEFLGSLVKTLAVFFQPTKSAQ